MEIPNIVAVTIAGIRFIYCAKTMPRIIANPVPMIMACIFVKPLL